MSRVDHWADVRDRSLALNPLPVRVPKPPAPKPKNSPPVLEELEDAKERLAAKERQLDALCAEIEAMGRWDGPFAAQRIILSVCKAYGLSRTELMSPRRYKYLVRARQHAFHAIKHNTRLSLPAIGKLFGGLDHTTILHGIRQHERRLAGEMA